MSTAFGSSVCICELRGDRPLNQTGKHGLGAPSHDVVIGYFDVQACDPQAVAREGHRDLDVLKFLQKIRTSQHDGVVDIVRENAGKRVAIFLMPASVIQRWVIALNPIWHRVFALGAIVECDDSLSSL